MEPHIAAFITIDSLKQHDDRDVDDVGILNYKETTHMKNIPLWGNRIQSSHVSGKCFHFTQINIEIVNIRNVFIVDCSLCKLECYGLVTRN